MYLPHMTDHHRRSPLVVMCPRATRSPNPFDVRVTTFNYGRQSNAMSPSVHPDVDQVTGLKVRVLLQHGSGQNKSHFVCDEQQRDGYSPCAASECIREVRSSDAKVSVTRVHSTSRSDISVYLRINLVLVYLFTVARWRVAITADERTPTD